MHSRHSHGCKGEAEGSQSKIIHNPGYSGEDGKRNTEHRITHQLMADAWHIQVNYPPVPLGMRISCCAVLRMGGQDMHVTGQTTKQMGNVLCIKSHVDQHMSVACVHTHRDMCFQCTILCDIDTQTLFGTGIPGCVR